MNKATIHRIIGFTVFLITSIVYLSTVQPSVSFWDCGEFVASAFSLQVPHPPGTPFFLILGRLFSLIPFGSDIAFRVNMVSVFSSSFTILFLYLVAVKLIQNFKNKEDESLLESLFTYIAAAIGALSLAFSDTFWFNAAEAEVYALATFFIAFVTWLMMVWNEKAEDSDNEKYILMIAYLVGLSTGVHLMSVLAIVTITLVIYIKKYLTDEETFRKTVYYFIGHAAIVLVIAGGLWLSAKGGRPTLEEQKAFDFKFLMMAGAASLIYVGILYKKIFQANSFYLPIIVGGIALYVVYPGIVKHMPNLISSIGKANLTLDILIFFAIFGILGYLIYWTTKTDRQTLHLVFKAVLFSIIGFTTYSMIIIRANQDTPINLNSPKTFPETISYLNREQYGDQPIFKRRFTNEPHQQVVYNNYSSDLDFFWTYQMDHMFNRYLLWNFAGRVSTVQEAGVDWSKFFAIPFLLGLFGLYYHFKKDWKLATAFLIMFIFLGYLTAFYQNQQEPQPRERDYFYVGAFFVYSIWIALGIRGVFDLIKESVTKSSLLRPIYIVIALSLVILVPVNMLKANYFEHDRSRNYIPWDYSYNLLQSVAPNAVLFTNGDNDTFPLWYLQDVQGVRQDVRVANLSLLNTPWYIKQLKNTEPYGAAKIKMTLSDDEIDRVGPSEWNPREIDIPVPPKVYEEFGITDTSVTNKGKMSWTMKNTVQYGKIKAVRVQDILALDLIRANNWERPIYFSVTTSDQSKIGLESYLDMEGLAFRLTPQKFNSFYDAVNEKIMWDQLMNEPEGFSFDYKPGFKYRGLNDSTVFKDDNHSRLTLNYRNSYIRLAVYYLYSQKKPQKAVEVLDKMEEIIPRREIPMDYRLLNDIANTYFNAGANKQYVSIAREVESVALDQIRSNPANVNGEYNPYLMLKQIYDNLGEYDKFLDVLKILQGVVPNDPTVQKLLKDYEALAQKQRIAVPEQNK